MIILAPDSKNVTSYGHVLIKDIPHCLISMKRKKEMPCCVHYGSEHNTLQYDPALSSSHDTWMLTARLNNPLLAYKNTSFVRQPHSVVPPNGGHLELHSHALRLLALGNSLNFSDGRLAVKDVVRLQSVDDVSERKDDMVAAELAN